MNAITFSAELTRLATEPAGGVKATFHIPEVNKDEAAKLFGLMRKRLSVAVVEEPE